MKKYNLIFLVIFLISCTNTTEDSGIKTVESKIANKPIIPTVSLKPTGSRIQSAYITKTGAIDCFKEGLKNSFNELIFCETSAVAYVDNHLFFASQTPLLVDNRSSLLQFSYTENSPFPYDLQYMTDAPFVQSLGYKGLSITPDGNYMVVTTGFDRIMESSHEWDNYNTLLFWPTNTPSAVKTVMPTTVKEIVSSVSLRQKIALALSSSDFPESIPYFKVEGLAIIPGNKLLLGISEVGESDENFEKVVQIVSVSYEIVDEELQLADDYELIYNFDPQSIPTVRYTNWLSSLEYDKYRNTLFLLTNFETLGIDQRVGGYLWSLSLQELYNNKPATLLCEKKGFPLVFSRKAEGITLLSENRAFIVYNDDHRVGKNIIENSDIYGYKKAHQAIYSIVEFR